MLRMRHLLYRYHLQSLPVSVSRFAHTSACIIPCSRQLPLSLARRKDLPTTELLEAEALFVSEAEGNACTDSQHPMLVPPKCPHATSFTLSVFVFLLNFCLACKTGEFLSGILQLAMCNNEAFSGAQLSSIRSIANLTFTAKRAKCNIVHVHVH